MLEALIPKLLFLGAEVLAGRLLRAPLPLFGSWGHLCHCLAAEGTSATVWQLRAPLPLFGSWGHLFHCLAAEGIGLKSLQPFSLSCCLIMKETVTSTLRFCSLKQPLMGHHRFGPLLITYLCWGESSNYLLASHYHLIFPTSKWNQARKMEKNYARYSYLFLLLKLLGLIFQARGITGMIK